MPGVSPEDVFFNQRTMRPRTRDPGDADVVQRVAPQDVVAEDVGPLWDSGGGRWNVHHIRLTRPEVDYAPVSDIDAHAVYPLKRVVLNEPVMAMQWWKWHPAAGT